MEEKNDIEKIEEQINQLKENDQEEKVEILNSFIHEEKPIMQNNEVTKVIDDIGDIVQVEEVGGDPFEPTKTEVIVNDYKPEEVKKEEVVEEKKEEVVVPTSTQETANKEKTNKKKKKLPIIILIVAVLLVLIIVLLIFLLPRNKNTKKEEEVSYTKSEQKEIIQKFGDAVKGIILIYSDKKDVLLDYEAAVKLLDFDYEVKCSEHEIYDDGNIYLNKCTINKYKTSVSYGEKQEKEELKISEDAIKVYVSKAGKKATLKEPKNKDEYNVYGAEIKEAYTDLTLLGEDSDYLYYSTYTNNNFRGNLINYKTNKVALEGIAYQSILPIKLNTGYDLDYVVVKIDNKWGVFNLQNGQQVLKNSYNNIGAKLESGYGGNNPYVYGIGNSFIATYYYDTTTYAPRYGLYDYRKGYFVFSDDKKQMSKSGDYLWVVDSNNNGHIYDSNGNEILSGVYNAILGLVDGKYVLVNDKSTIKVIGLDGKEYYNYGTHYLYYASNYGISYNNGALFQLTNPEAMNNPDYDYRNSCIEIVYNPSDKTGEYKTTYCGGVAKPILYLYPEKTTKVTVSFEHPELLETTYPKFTGKWEVTAHKDGSLYDKNNQYYYALYWDETKVHATDFSTGFYVEDKDAIKFLEEKLSIIGLNDKEKNEFIMYWLPILEKNKKNLVYFELTDERESVNKILIDPKPDSLLRVVIHVKKVNQKTDIKEQKLTKFVRRGFSAVEWGGTTY